jgi:hypothetical protein
MRWRLCLVLIMMIVIAGEVPSPPPRGDAVLGSDVFGYVQEPSLGCGLPASVAFSEPQEAYLERNREAAAEYFSMHSKLDTQNVILHYPCVRSISVNLDAYRSRGIISTEIVRSLLDWAGLDNVMVFATWRGIHFGGYIRQACIAGIYMPAKTVVAVIEPLPGTDRCLL